MFGIWGGGSSGGISDDEGTHGRLDTTNAELQEVIDSLGTDGTSPQVIPGTGVRGWLRSVYDTLLDTFTTIDFNGAEAHSDSEAVLAELAVIDAHTAANSSVTISHITAPVTIANTVSVVGAVTINNAVLSVTIAGGATAIGQTNEYNAIIALQSKLGDGTQVTHLVDGNGGYVGIAANAMTVTVTNPSTATSDATAANQATEISRLTSIANLVTGGTARSVPVDAANRVLGVAANAATIAGAVTINNASLGVSVSNFPTTQAVSLAANITVGNFPTTQAVTVSNFPTTQPVSIAAAVTVQGTVAVTGSGDASAANQTTGNTTLSTIASLITNATAQTKLTDGTTIASMISGDSGQNTLLVAPSRKEVSYSLAVSAATTGLDVSNYKSVCVHVLSVGSGSTTAFQGSNDNTNWVAVPLNQLASAIVTSTGTATAATMWCGPLPYRYFRINVTGGSGTSTGIIEYSSLPLPLTPVSIQGSGQSGTWTVQPGNTVNTAPWSVGGGQVATSINAATSATTGASKAYGVGMKCQSMQVVVAGTGSWTALTVLLEGSNDGGTTWFTLATSSSTTGGAVFSSNQVAQTIRARTTVATVASLTPTISAFVLAA